jgi:hypothetical protein
MVNGNTTEAVIFKTPPIMMMQMKTIKKKMARLELNLLKTSFTLIVWHK